MSQAVEPTEDSPAAVDLWPAQGEEVLFNSGHRWHLAEVMSPAASDGELSLLCTFGEELTHQRATHGNHENGWLSYDEAAVQLKRVRV